MSSATVTVTEHLFIPLADGTRLAARLWLPDGAEARPVPAILEYIPYRKRDGTRSRDEPMHGYFAAQGYAVLRVDLRGAGESDGLLDDEYLAQELADGAEVIAWIADQPWCSGAVGMMGKSWGGFNCLQVAALRPPALKAILTVCSTDDRFGDDIHYMGGNLLNDNLWWGTIMLAYQARPADPALVGAGWRDQWRQRLDHMPLWPGLWLKHQRRDDYWRHGSVCEDWSAITCPVFAVGGWADSYTNAVPRLLENLTVPRLGLIGPWAHIYPQDGVPGPAIGFLQEATRWWDHWLKGEDRGIMDEPMMRAYIEDSSPPATTRPEAAGRWVGETLWPSEGIARQSWYLSDQGLSDSPAGDCTPRFIKSPLWTGITGGAWMGTGVAGEMPADQRPDDAHSLCFDSAPLDEALDVLGFPEVELALSADAANGQLAVRLCDVAPDGSSRRVSYGVLNLSHRHGSADPEALVPGRREMVRLRLKVCGHRFAAGHRLRLAISSAYWPLLWPAAEAAGLTISPADSRFHLPLRHGLDRAVGFAPPARAALTPTTLVRPSELVRQAEIDFLNNQARYRITGKGGLFGEGVHRFDEIDTTVGHDLDQELTISGDDPLSAKAVITQSYEMGRDGWRIRIETTTVQTADAQTFHLSGELKAYENGQLIRQREWQDSIPRDLL